jgi:hypothetical protein
MLPDNLRKKGEQHRAVFFDLAFMKKVGEDKEAKENAYVEMMRKLDISN